MVARVAAQHVVGMQIVAATAGALMTVIGVAILARTRPDPTGSEWRTLAAAAAFFCVCLGVFVMAMGVGLFH